MREFVMYIYQSADQTSESQQNNSNKEAVLWSGIDSIHALATVKKFK